MAGAMRKTMVWLGLAEDDGRGHVEDGYDSYDDEPTATRDVRSRELAAPGEEDSVVERRPAPVSSLADRRPGGSAAADSSAALSRIVTIHPHTYNEARVIGEQFRGGVPVIMNLTNLDDSDAKRLVDFAAGLIFGLRGTIEKVTSKVFLLSPHKVTVTAEDKARIAGGAFFNQS